MKTKIFPSLIIATFFYSFFSLGTIETAEAGYNPVSRNICTLMVKPFDTSKDPVPQGQGDQYIKYLDEVCKDFVDYPNAYAPQPPKKSDNPLKANAEGKHIPITRHDHIYYNDTFDDDMYYKAYMDRFEITIESDGFNSIDLSKIECQTPYPTGYDTTKLVEFKDCVGSLNDLWGGTTVTKKQVGNNSYVVTWNFGQTENDGQYKGRPLIWANNGPNFPKGDFTNENHRDIGFKIHLPSKDNNDIWSATTTSRALVADLQTQKSTYNLETTDKKSCTNNDPSTGWCYIQPPAGYTKENVYTTSNKTFYWFPIGSVTTVWREKEVPPPPKVCQSLELFDTPQLLTPEEVQQNTGSANNWPMYKVTLKKLQFEGNQVPAGAKIKWKSTDPNGKFWIPGFFGGLATTNKNEFEIPFKLPANSNSIYYTGNGPVQATVSNIPAALNNPTSCKDSVRIPAQNVCTDLNATMDQNAININGKKAYPITVTTITFSPQNSIPANANLLWTSNNPQGEFWKDSFLYGENPDLSEDIATQIFLRKGNVETNTDEKKLYYIGKPGDQIKVTLADIPASQISAACQAPFTIPPEEEEIECKQLLVDHAKEIFVGSYSTFKAKAINTNSKSMKNKIKYSVDKGHGEFFLKKPANIGKNSSAMVYEIGGSAKPKPGWFDGANQNLSEALKGSAVDKTSLSKAVKDILIDLATGQNQSNGDGTPENPAKPGMTIDPADYGQGIDFNNFGNDSASTLEIKNYTFASLLALNLDGAMDPANPKYTLESVLGEDGVKINQPGLDVNFNLPPAVEEITVNPNTLVYFVAKTPGKKVIHVETVGVAADGTIAGSDNEGSDTNTGTDTTPVPKPGTGGTGYGPGALGDITGTVTGSVWTTGETVDLTNSYGNSINLYGNTVILDEEDFIHLTEQVPDWFITGIAPKPSPGPDPSPESNFSGNPRNYGMPSVLALNLPSDVIKKDQPAKSIKELLEEDIQAKIPQPAFDFAPSNPCRRDFDIKPVICESLGLVTITKGDLVVGLPMEFTVDPKDQNGKKLPAKTKFKISKTTDGEFRSVTNKKLTTTALLSDFPIKVIGATKAGKINISVDPKDPAYAQICAGEIKVVKKEKEEFVCKSLNLTATKTAQKGFTLNPSDITKIKSINPTNVKAIDFTSIQKFKDASDLNIVPKSFIPDFKVGETVFINISPVDTDGKKLPANTKIKVANTTGGKLIDKNGTVIGNLVTVSSFPLTLKETTKEGTVTVAIDPSDPNYSKDCIGTIKVVKVEELLECKSLSYTLSKKTVTGTDLPVNQLEKNEVYTLSASSIYSKQHPDVIDYSIDPTYGTFIKIDGNDTVINNITLLIKLTQASQALDKAGIEALLGPVTSDKISKAGNQKVVLVIYNNALPAKADILKMNSQGFDNADCKKVVPIVVPVGECKALILAPNSINGTVDSEFTITLVEHKGSAKVTLVGKGSLQKGGQSGSTITFTKEEVANAATVPLTFIYKHDATFDKTKDVIELLAQAINEDDQVAPQCQAKINTSVEVQPQECIDLEITNPDNPWKVDEGDDNQLFQIDVTTNPNTLKNDLYYHWEVDDCDDCEWDDTNDKTVSDKGDFAKMLNGIEVNENEEPLINIWATKTSNASDTFKDSNGNQICKDYIKANFEEDEEDDEQPEIKKYSFKLNKLNDADEVTNIDEDVAYVNFMAVFNIGKGPKFVKIEDLNLKSGEIAGSLGGKLVFEDMIINIIESSKTYTILETDGYSPTSTNGKLDEFSDDEAKDNIKNLEAYICESEDDKDFCIDIVEMDIVDKYTDAKKLKKAELTTKIADHFSNGKPIAFKNLNKLSSNSKIVIKYQLDNQTKINDEICATLNASTGCGEEFKNKIKFTTYEDEKFTKKDDEDSDSALVIAICPYILTRQGGDVFFHDVVKTGVDVAQCSEVKGGQGPGITPVKPTIEQINKTGAGDAGEDVTKLTLDLPSHDICRFSNLKGNIEGYNNVLENFSSTICELRAEVAEVWKIKNINDAIAANIKRISRFADSTGSSSTGVIYKEDGDYTINAAKVQDWINNGPPARTIIVKGHDLIIKNDIILYDDEPGAKARSAAFIVINGNIIITDPAIERLDGIFIATDMDLTKDPEVGKIIQQGLSKIPLTINGNLIGNVYELFKNRQGVGDPKRDEGSVTIKYSSRLLLNPPPGLNELLSIQQALVP